jgi:hypothetical protein
MLELPTLQDNPKEMAILKVNANSLFEVNEVRLLFRDLNYFYNQVNFFLQNSQSELGVKNLVDVSDQISSYGTSSSVVYFYIRNRVVPLRSERLRLYSAKFNSPGFWEFLGKLNPLEIIRLLLNDEHERKKDRSYRSYQEKRRLSYENDLREIEVHSKSLDIVGKQIELMRSAGASEDEIQNVMRQTFYRPLKAVSRHLDSEQISDSEITYTLSKKELPFGED